MKHKLAAMAALMVAAPLAAQDAGGDAEAGATQFDRQCVACHVVADDGGEVLAGRNARTGPNLFEVVGATPGSRHDFAYSNSLVAYGESGAIWAEDNMVSYLQDPSGHLREALDDPRARSKMAYRVNGDEAAVDIHAFLARYDIEDTSGDATGEAEEAALGDPAQDSAGHGGAHDLTPDTAAGETLYDESCANCHGPTARGMASFPRLAGSDEEFLITRLVQYKAGERVGPNSGLMIPVAQDLSEQDIADVSAYIATTYD